jgi:hypothetical protein
MRLSGCTTPKLKAAFEKEWSSIQLMGLPKGHGTTLSLLTERRTVGEGTSTASTLVAPVEARVRYWRRFMSSTYPLLTSAAVRLLPLHVTTCSCERNWSLWGITYSKARNALAIERAAKLIFIKANLGSSSSDDQEVLLRVLEEEEDDE